MEKKTVSAIVLTMLLASMFVFVSLDLVPLVHAQTPISRVNDYGRGTSTSGTFTVTMNATPTLGNILVCVTGARADIVPSVTNIVETGVDWTFQVRGSETSLSNSIVEIWVGVIGSGASSTVTITWTTIVDGGCIADIWEYSGVATNNFLDVSATNHGVSTSTTDTGTTATTSTALELWIGGTSVKCGGYTNTQTNPTNGFNLTDGKGDSSSGWQSLAYLDKIVSSTGTANSGTTISGSYPDYAGAIITLSAYPLVHPLQVTASPSSATIQIGQTQNFTSTVFGGYTPYSYQWYLDHSAVSGATSASWTFTPVTRGIYYVYLSVTDSIGNTAQSDTACITAELYNITFGETGVGSDFTGAVVTIDGMNYTANDLPISFMWDNDSTHTFAFQSTLVVVSSVEQYVWESTSGLSTLQSDLVTVTRLGSVIGNYARAYGFSSPKPSTVGAATDPKATFLTSKCFFANNLFWVFYFDASNMVYSTSSDGSSWSNVTTVRPVGSYDKFSVAFDGTCFHYAVADYRHTLYYRKGISNPDGIVTWLAPEQMIDVSGLPTNHMHQGEGVYGVNLPCVSVDSFGYAWISFSYYDSFWFCWGAIRSGNNNGTWGSGLSYGYVVQCDCVWRTEVVPLTNGKMLVVFDSYACGRARSVLWDGTTWNGALAPGGGTPATTSLVAASYGSHGVYDVYCCLSAVSVQDSAYLVFLKRDTYDIIYANYSYPSNSWSPEVTLQAGASSTSSPTLSVDASAGCLLCFWAGSPTANHIYYERVFFNGTVDTSPTDWITETTALASNDCLTSSYQTWDNFIGIVYMEGATSPYEVRFACLRLTSISPVSASVYLLQSVAFESITIGAGPPYSYQWYLNGSAVSGATSASWTFTPVTRGIYYVYLSVTDSIGNTAQSDTACITAELYNITFGETGVGSDFTGTVLTMDGSNYTANDLPISFMWDNDSTHTFAFQSPLLAGSGAKEYDWTSTTGLSTLQSDSITITGHGSLTGNYVTLVHDVAVTSVTANRTWVYQGLSTNATVTVLNKGDFVENATVTLYYNITADDAVGIQNVALAPGQNQTIIFVWNTTGVPCCPNYTITGVASIPADNYLIDNTLAGGTIKVRILGEINGDDKVDIGDVATAAKAFGSHVGCPRWNSDADANGDGTIDIQDIALIAKHFGQHCS